MMNFKGNAKILFFLLVLADGFQEGLSAKSLICFGRNVMELKDFVACLLLLKLVISQIHILLFALSVWDVGVEIKL